MNWKEGVAVFLLLALVILIMLPRHVPIDIGSSDWAKYLYDLFDMQNIDWSTAQQQITSIPDNILEMLRDLGLLG